MAVVKDKKEFLKYLKSIGIVVNTRTKARGNRGFFCRNRIDISKNVEEERFMDTLAHEFAHYIHAQIEPSNFNKGGSLSKLFECENTENIKDELLKVTNFVDPNSKMEKLMAVKEQYIRPDDKERLLRFRENPQDESWMNK